MAAAPQPETDEDGGDQPTPPEGSPPPRPSDTAPRVPEGAGRGEEKEGEEGSSRPSTPTSLSSSSFTNPGQPSDSELLGPGHVDTEHHTYSMRLTGHRNSQTVSPVL